MRVNIVRHILPKFVYLDKCLYCLVEVNLSGTTFNLSLKFDYTVPEIPPAIRDSGVFIGANRLSNVHIDPYLRHYVLLLTLEHVRRKL